MNLPTSITIPATAEGEIYAGILLGNDGEKSRHVILLPGDNDDGNHQDQSAWAKSIGGRLPTPRELNLLRANASEHFQGDCYWSNAQHASYSDCAWCQSFFNGYQCYYHKSARLRARAVRSVPIE